MLSQRVKAALVFIPLILILIYFGGWAFNSFIGLVLLVAAVEFTQLLARTGYHPTLPLVLFGVLLFLLQRWFFPAQYLGILFTLLLVILVLVALIQYESGTSDSGLTFAINLAIIFYLGWVGSFFISLRNLPDGLGWTLTALPAVWLADSGAYFIGRWLGKRKMSPRLSPGKTWAGLAGALLTGAASGPLLILLWRAIGFLPIVTPLWQGAVMGLILAVLTPMGDLFISLFKRTAGVKDTGNIIPGHGGFLDRIDTWIWAAMLGYYLVQIFQSI